MAVVVYARAIVVHLRGCRSVRRPEAGWWWRQWFSSPGRVRVPLPARLPCAGAALLSCAALCRADQGPPSPVAAGPVRVPLRVPVHSLVFLLRLGLRALALLLRFGPLLLLAPLALLCPRLLAPRWLDRLLRATEASGPAFVKLGQWAGTRRDLFSQDFCGRFSRLQSQARPHPWAHTERCLRRCFGAAWRRLLVLRSREPVGSGCVAQVYRGWARVEDQEVEKDQVFRRLAREEDDVLRLEEMEEEEEEAWGMPSLWGSKEMEVEEEGMQGPPEGGGRLIPVAIKVLHPGVRRQVEIDLLLMRAGSWLLHYLPGLKWLSLPEIVEEFEKLMTKQIDLRFEATNIEKFRENFQDVDFVKFPTPLRRFVTRSVLVETFEESEPIANYLRPEVPAEVKQRIARMGIETMLKMVFVDNFVHGDLHPGNILVQRPPVEAEPRGRATLTGLWDAVVVSVRPQPPPYQLVLLDAGIVAQLSPGDLANFRAVFTAVVLRQGERVAELILNHARANECRDVPRFKREMALLVDGALSTNTLSLGKIQVAELLSRVFGLLITHKVKLESNFASIVIAIMVLEGLGRSLDPNVDILELAKPMLLKNCASML